MRIRRKRSSSNIVKKNFYKENINEKQILEELKSNEYILTEGEEKIGKKNTIKTTQL